MSIIEEARTIVQGAEIRHHQYLIQLYTQLVELSSGHDSEGDILSVANSIMGLAIQEQERADITKERIQNHFGLDGDSDFTTYNYD